jgi:hypothetical protein
MPSVQTLDFAKLKGHHFFNLRAMVMWTINDFPRCGLLSGCVHQGYIPCPKCGSKTTSQHSLTLRKMVYMGHCRWLQRKHPYQLQWFKDAFNAHLEKKR